MSGSGVPSLIAGRYQVESVLGRGGMAEVYGVLDTRNGDEVALKRLRLPGGSKDKLAAELFEREFHTLSELAHPRIIEVYDYGVDDDGAYYTMELLGGQDLRALGQPDWQQACALLRDVASSLAIVHSRGLLHGDISPRNVRCTGDGRAKLLDFGAMLPMGPTRRVVGTAPFVAPEMVQLQSLDGRADIYGLGALGYRLLSGRHAYPARAFSELPAIWQAPPPPLSELAEVPDELSDLIMECLELNRTNRPRSAGLVMERLCTIASLPLEEHSDVATAYLTTPKLVGRDGLLLDVRKRLIAMPEEGGPVIVARGQPGSGRSRFLDACVLEAKLLGAHVVRVDESDSREPYGAVRAVCEQLFELAPASAERAARLHAPVLAHAIDHRSLGSPRPEPPSKRQLLAALRDFILGASRELKLVIALDRAERVDSESSSLLVALAHKARRRTLALIVSTEDDEDGNATIALYGERARVLDLTPLDESGTEQLILSLFGNASHSLTVAREVHRISAGNPRAIMQLATHLVDAGAIRYQAGSFMLPERLRDSDLPTSVGEVLEQRLSGLCEDAMELACALALTEPGELSTRDYVELTSHGDRRRTFRAIDDLVRARVLEPTADSYRLADGTWKKVVGGLLTPERRRALHSRLARVFETEGSVTRRAYHLMESDQPEAAIRVLLSQYLANPDEPPDPLEHQVPGLLDLFERASSIAQGLDLSPTLKTELQMRTIVASVFMGDYARFVRTAPPLLQQLTRESGVWDYEQLGHISDPAARLQEALARAQQRYEQAEPGQRGIEPIEAIRRLTRLCASYASMSAISLDVSLIKNLPSLRPLAPLAPAIDLTQQVVAGMCLVVEGRMDRAYHRFLEILERLDDDVPGLPALYRKWMRLGVLYAAGLLEANFGRTDALRRVAELEREPGHRVNAQRVRASVYLIQGHLEEARAAERRAEIVMLEDGQQQRFPNTTVRNELRVYGLLGDLAAVRRVTERIVQAAKSFPKWEPLAIVGRATCCKLQGEDGAALSLLDEAMGMVEAGRDTDWTFIAAEHVEGLTRCGRVQEAVELGRERLAHGDREGLFTGNIAAALAQALLSSGQHEAAAATADAVIDESIELQARGVLLGSLYELRARIAIAQGDEAGFKGSANLCAQHYRPRLGGQLAHKYDRLLRAAERAGIPGTERPQTSRPPPELLAAHTEVSSIRSRLMECTDSRSRALCVLDILAAPTAASSAHLFAVTAGQVRLLCSLPPAPPPDGLEEAVQEHLLRLLDTQQQVLVDPDEVPTVFVGARKHQSESASMPPEPLMRHGGEEGSEIHAVPLFSTSEGQPVLAGVATLSVAAGSYRGPPTHLFELLAGALLEHDVVDPVTRLR